MIKKYLDVLFAGNTPQSEIPEDTKNWRRALWLPSLNRVFEGIDSKEGHGSIVRRNASQIPLDDKTAVGAIVFNGYWDDKFLAIDTTTTKPSQEAPEGYTFYQQ